MSMDKQSGSLIENLRAKGYRLTKHRVKLLELINKQDSPISADELRNKLSKINPINKTTVYRELGFLKREGLINDVDFGDGKKLYESSHQKHHHHLVCQNCHNIQEISFKNDLSAQQKEIEKLKHFKILEHQLEFFGLCAKCK